MNSTFRLLALNLNSSKDMVAKLVFVRMMQLRVTEFSVMGLLLMYEELVDILTYFQQVEHVGSMYNCIPDEVILQVSDAGWG